MTATPTAQGRAPEERSGPSAILPAGTVETAWGDLIEDRGSQVTYSALGQLAPLAAKAEWDPTGDKKRAHRVQWHGKPSRCLPSCTSSCR